jgi:hypothetical protein
MAGWGSRHTFGNLERRDRNDGDTLPFMPLEQMYVQPDAKKASDRNDTGAPILQRIEHALEKASVVIVQADFGMGKSLTSRTLACQRAKAFLGGLAPSPGLKLPVYVRCADDLDPEDLSLGKIVRRACKRQAQSLGLSLKLDDEALAPPDPQQRVLFLVDGLDEVHLGDIGLETFFQCLRDEATDRHRFVVFSRPGIVSRADLSEANLSEANLSEANLSEANLSGARYNQYTYWLENFQPDAVGAIREETLSVEL